MRDLQPDPKVYPRCVDCKTPYVLRRGLLVKPYDMKSMHFGWCWQRDCKHKKAPAEVVDVRPKSKRSKR